MDMKPTLADENPLKFICKICGERWKTKQSYKDHMKFDHTDFKPYPCDKCEKKFKTGFGLTKHTRRVHEDMGNVKKYKCDLCDAVYKREECLRLHRRGHVKESLKFKCEICHKGYLYESALKQHMLYHDKNTTVCPICGKNVKFINKHLKTHTKEYKQKNFKCTKCDLKFPTQSHSNRHFLNVHDENALKFICDVCGKQVSTKISLDSHVLNIHKGIKRYKCSYCDKSFAGRSTLRDHILTHTGERPHKCEFCDKCFTQRTPLKIHMRLHTGEKPYECNICNKGFVSKTAMESHRKNNHGTTVL